MERDKITTSSQPIAKPNVVRSFFVLTYAGQFMDSNLLSSGLYTTDIPKLFSKDTSIELLIQQGKTITDMMGNEFIPSSYFDNLAKCKLTEVVVSFPE
jgi:hypothetical protein